jgi:hypothetical protein
LGKARGEATLPGLLRGDAGAICSTRLTALLPQLTPVKSLLSCVATFLSVLSRIALLKTVAALPILGRLAALFAPFLPRLAPVLAVLPGIAAFTTILRGVPLLRTAFLRSLAPLLASLAGRFAAGIPACIFLNCVAAFLLRLPCVAPILSYLPCRLTMVLPGFARRTSPFLARLARLRSRWRLGAVCCRRSLTRGRTWSCRTRSCGGSRSGCPWRAGSWSGCGPWRTLCRFRLGLVWPRHCVNRLEQGGGRDHSSRCKQLFDHVTVPKNRGRPTHVRWIDNAT